MRKHLNFSFACFLATLITAGAYAQQGNVAAGGDATGTGGSMSYSIGQVDYLYYSSEQGSMSLGLQQTWHIGTEPPPTLDISDMVIEAGESLCFNALQTVTVAGDGDQFVVQAYGHADIIAGHNILLKHGTNVELYGSLHARTSNTFCPPQQSLLASFSEPIPSQPLFEPETHSTFFKVYPNPTSGDFTLELLKIEEASLLLIEIYTMQGNLVLGKELPAEKLNNLSIAGRQPGIYLVRVMKQDQVGTVKIIKQ